MYTLSLTDSFDLITLTETWLDEDFHDRELYRDGYNIFRPDRCGRGGASLLEKRNYLCHAFAVMTLRLMLTWSSVS